MVGISSALPFLAVRVLYSILGAFAPAPTSGFGSTGIPSTDTNSLSKFSSFNGSWEIFLFMSLLMEYITVLIYLTVGIFTPPEKDAVAAYDTELQRRDQSTKDAFYPNYQREEVYPAPAQPYNGYPARYTSHEERSKG